MHVGCFMLNNHVNNYIVVFRQKWLLLKENLTRIPILIGTGFKKADRTWSLFADLVTRGLSILEIGNFVTIGVLLESSYLFWYFLYSHFVLLQLLPGSHYAGCVLNTLLLHTVGFCYYYCCYFNLWKLVYVLFITIFMLCLLTFYCHEFDFGRYYKNQTLKTAFAMAPADPTVDLNMQL